LVAARVLIGACNPILCRIHVASGVPVGGLTPGTYVSVTRKWATGDKVVCRFAMSLWASPVRGNVDIV